MIIRIRRLDVKIKNYVTLYYGYAYFLSKFEKRAGDLKSNGTYYTSSQSHNPLVYACVLVC